MITDFIALGIIIIIAQLAWLIHAQRAGFIALARWALQTKYMLRDDLHCDGEAAEAQVRGVLEDALRPYNSN